jgi:hypothetical protein
LVFFICSSLFSCKTDVAENKKIDKTIVGIEEASDVKINYTMGGNIKAVLFAPSMLNIQDDTPYVVFPKNIHVDFYNISHTLESRLDAKYAKYQQNQSKIFLKDSVVVFNIEKGDTLYCNELYWDRNRTGTEFFTDKPVRIRTKSEIIDGKGMEASQDFKNWRILHSVGTISVPASTFPE